MHTDVDKKFLGFLGEYSTFLVCTRLVLTAEFRGLASLSTWHFLNKKYVDPFRVLHFLSKKFLLMNRTVYHCVRATSHEGSNEVDSSGFIVLASQVESQWKRNFASCGPNGSGAPIGCDHSRSMSAPGPQSEVD